MVLPFPRLLYEGYFLKKCLVDATGILRFALRLSRALRLESELSDLRVVKSDLHALWASDSHQTIISVKKIKTAARTVFIFLVEVTGGRPMPRGKPLKLYGNIKTR